MNSASARQALPGGIVSKQFTKRISKTTPSPVRCQSQIGDKVLPMLRGPGDLLFLAPRVALGAILSTSQNLERLPADIERLSTVIADPRPLEEKQNELLLEIEDRVAAFIERGLIAENEVISTMNDLIPEEMKAAMSEDLRNAVLTPRPIPSSEAADDWTTAPAPGFSSSSSEKPLATWTISSMDEEDGAATFGGPSSAGRTSSSNGNGSSAEGQQSTPVSPAAVAASQAAAELVEIQTAVLAVKNQLAELQANTDVSRTSMLKLNLREATQSLSGRLEQRALVVNADPSMAGAVEEAQVLLTEVRSLM